MPNLRSVLGGGDEDRPGLGEDRPSDDGGGGEGEGEGGKGSPASASTSSRATTYAEAGEHHGQGALWLTKQNMSAALPKLVVNMSCNNIMMCTVSMALVVEDAAISTR